jgi:hypothetical protein
VFSYFGSSSLEYVKRRIQMETDFSVRIFIIGRTITTDCFGIKQLSFIAQLVDLLMEVEVSSNCIGLPLHHLIYLDDKKIPFQIEKDWCISFKKNNRTFVREPNSSSNRL